MAMCEDFISSYLDECGLQYKEPVWLGTGHVLLEYCEPSEGHPDY